MPTNPGRRYDGNNCKMAGVNGEKRRLIQNSLGLLGRVMGRPGFGSLLSSRPSSAPLPAPKHKDVMFSGSDGTCSVYFRLIWFDVKSPLLSSFLTPRVILNSSGLICSISQSGKNLATIGCRSVFFLLWVWGTK